MGVDYVEKDVGELYALIFTASMDELEKILKAGLRLGHHGVVERVYEEINVRLLQEKGAPDDVVDEFLRANLRGDRRTAKKIAREYGVTLREPSKKELEQGLRYAIGVRGYSIDDPSTSVGAFYQALYGDPRNEVITLPSDRMSIQIPYSEIIDPQLKQMLNKWLLTSKGYTPIQDQL